MWPFTRRRDFEAMEQRSSDWFAAFRDIVPEPTYAGTSVTETGSVCLPAVYRCIALNSETISSLPIDVYAKRGDARVPYSKPLWLVRPNEFQTTGEFISQSQVSLDIDGNCYWLKASDSSGNLWGLSVVNPELVTPEMTTAVDGRERIVYHVNTNTGRKTYPSTAIVHIRAMTMPGELKGVSPVAAARQTIGIGLAAEQYGGNFFGTGATVSGLVETPGAMTQEQADRLKASFAKKHGGVSRSHAIGVLSGGAKWVALSVKPDEAQFLETRRYTAVEIANLYGVPAELVSAGGTEGAKGYVTALHTRMRMWYITGLLPRLTRLEKAMSDLLPERTAYVKFNVGGLLRMDPAERTAFYASAQLGEWMTRNEIRALEEMDPLSDGDEFLHSVQWSDSDMREKVEALGALVRAGFDPVAALNVVGLPSMPYLDVQPVTVRPITEDGTQLAPAKTEEPQP